MSISIIDRLEPHARIHKSKAHAIDAIIILTDVSRKYIIIYVDCARSDAPQHAPMKEGSLGLTMRLDLILLLTFVRGGGSHRS